MICSRQSNFGLWKVLLPILLIVLFGCQTAEPKKKRAKKAKPQNMGMELIVAEDALKLKGEKSKQLKTKPESKPAVKKVSEAKIKSCLKILKRYQLPYRELAIKTKSQPSQTAAWQITGTDPRNCTDAKLRKEVVKAAISALDTHSGKIGVLLPLSGQQAALANFIVEGMKANFQENGLSFEQSVIVVDIGTTSLQTEQRIAEMVFKHQVTTMVAGINEELSEVVAQWADQLNISSIIMTRDFNAKSPKANVFRIYPDEKKLAQTLVDASVNRGMKRIAILKPANGKSDALVEFFRQRVQEHMGTVVQDVTYEAGNFESMEAAARDLFGLDITKRRDEYQRAYARARWRARRAGMSFDARHVVISPIVDFDAVFIPDDFRTIRHFAKLFKYHGVQQIPMIGNHEWRSPALVKPFDEFLKGSFFADFIGSYGNVPKSLGATTSMSAYFVKPEDVIPTDFRLIGYRVGGVLGNILKTPNLKKRHVEFVLKKMKSNNENFFGYGPVFNETLVANWPTYVFKVAEEAVVLETSVSGQIPAINTPVKKANLVSGRRDIRNEIR